MLTLFTDLKNLFYNLYAWFGDWAASFGLWIFDGLLSIVDVALSTLPIPQALQDWSFANIFNGLPADLLSVLGYIGIPEVLAILSGAFLLRLTLRLIPFL